MVGNGRPTPPHRRDQPATIDLAATEVRVEPVGADASQAATATAPEASASASGEGARAPASEPPPAAAPIGSSRAPWPLIAAAAAGAAAVGVLVGALALAGLVQIRSGVAEVSNARVAPAASPTGVDAGRPIPDTRSEDLSQRIAKLEVALALAEPGGSAAGEARLATRPAAGDAVSARVSRLESSLSSLADGVAALTKRIDEVQAVAREGRERAEAAAKALEDLAPSLMNRGRVPAAEKGEVDRLADRLAAIETAAKVVESRVDASATRTVVDAGLRAAVLAAAVRAAAERGAPFASELAGIRPLVSDANALAPLTPFAAAGVPTAAALGAELSALLPAMARAVERPAPERGLLDRLQASADRLVRVRPLAEPPGDDVSTILARIEIKAGQADVAGALAELTKLPAPVRSLADAWIAKATARNAAIAAAQRLAAGALDALGRP